MYAPSFLARVEKNKLKLEDPENFGLWCGQFEGKNVKVKVEKIRKPRSTGKPDELGNQNGWYWGVILPLSAKELGYTVYEMHEVFTAEFAPCIFKDFGNKKVAVKIRSSEMDTTQFKDYIDSIIIKMAEMSVIIPEPIKI
jgi:hypothetical protein